MQRPEAAMKSHRCRREGCLTIFWASMLSLLLNSVIWVFIVHSSRWIKIFGGDQYFKNAKGSLYICDAGLKKDNVDAGWLGRQGIALALHSEFFGTPHMLSIVQLLGPRSLPWLIRALLDHISNKIMKI